MNAPLVDNDNDMDDMSDLFGVTNAASKPTPAPAAEPPAPVEPAAAVVEPPVPAAPAEPTPPATVEPPVAPVEPPPAPAVAAPAPAAPAEPKKDIFIPKKRFDEINNRYKQAQRELEELRTQAMKDVTGRPKISLNSTDKVKEYNKLLIEGKDEQAAAILATLLDEAAVKGAESSISQIETTFNRLTEKQQWNSTVAEIESAIPELNPDLDTFDPDLAENVLQFVEVYSRRMPRHQALEKAVSTVLSTERLDILERFIPKAEVQPPAPAAPAAPAATPATPPPTASVTKAIAAAKAQPPSPTMAPSASAGATPSILTMTDEEFASLPESTKRKLRGDML